MDNDNRQEHRQRVYKRVKFTFNNSTNSIDCILRNKSEHGAMLDFGSNNWVPDRFHLHDELEGYSVECQIVRRLGNTAGVKFVSELKSIRPSRKQSIIVPVEKPEVVEKQSVAYSIFPARFGKRRNTSA